MLEELTADDMRTLLGVIDRRANGTAATEVLADVTLTFLQIVLIKGIDEMTRKSGP